MHYIHMGSVVVIKVAYNNKGCDDDTNDQFEELHLLDRSILS